MGSMDKSEQKGFTWYQPGCLHSGRCFLNYSLCLACLAEFADVPDMPVHACAVSCLYYV